MKNAVVHFSKIIQQHMVRDSSPCSYSLETVFLKAEVTTIYEGLGDTGNLQLVC